MTELIHSSRSPFIHTRGRWGEEKAWLPAQGAAANRFKATTAAAAIQQQQQQQQRQQRMQQQQRQQQQPLCHSPTGKAANTANRFKAATAAAAAAEGAGAAAGAAGSSRLAFGKCPSPSRATRRRRPAHSPQANGRVEGQWPSRALSSTGRNAAAAPRAARRRRWGWRMPQLHHLPIH